MSIQERVYSIVAQQMGVSADTINAETQYVDDLGADSLDLTELVMEFEEEFDVTIPDEDAEQMKTVGATVTYIEQHAT
jgi:acyl carrier protein